MAYKVNTEDCVRCGVCAEVCPMSAIELKEEAAYIKPGQCIDCGGCAGSCPVNAIQPEQNT